MKALKSSLAKQVLADPKARVQLQSSAPVIVLVTPTGEVKYRVVTVPKPN